MKCAYFQYLYFDKKWDYWYDDTIVCGCPVISTTTEKKKKIHSKSTEVNLNIVEK
jgi:hypothetical protein